MNSVIKNELRQTRKVLLIWVGVMVIVSLFAYFKFVSMEDSMEQMAAMFSRSSKIILVMYGVWNSRTSLPDWYSCILYWLTLVGAFYAIYLGTSCVVREKEQGTSEYLFTKPVERGMIVLAKSAAALVNLALFALFVGACCWLIGVQQLQAISFSGVLLSILALFLTEIPFFAVGLASAGLTNSYRAASRLSMVVLILFYVIYFVAEYMGLRFLYSFTPLEYFNIYDLMTNGFSGLFLFLTALITVLCIGVAIERWRKKDF